MKLNVKQKTIISIVLFAVIFVALVLIATYCDFQVSKILTKNILGEGEYFANDFFGVMLESVGCIPIYLLIAFILCVLFWSCLKLWKKKPFNIICAVIAGILVVVASWYAVKDSVGYIFEHTLARTTNVAANLEALDKFEHSAAVYGVEAIFGLLIGGLAILATKQFKPEVLKKLLRFSLASACALLVANVLIMIIKDPVGRMRFRAINSTVGQGCIDNDLVKGYTPWYITNKQPNDAVLNAFYEAYAVKDPFKSFPSGHTCSAGSVYALIMIPTLFNFKEQKKGYATVLCWALPVLYTALVAISRIMVGAHYMSDVTFGGTIAFLCFVIAWEIFICKGEHFFALFPKARKKKAVTEENIEVEVAENVIADVSEPENAAIDNNDAIENSSAENESVENGVENETAVAVGEKGEPEFEEYSDAEVTKSETPDENVTETNE